MARSGFPPESGLPRGHLWEAASVDIRRHLAGASKMAQQLKAFHKPDNLSSSPKSRVVERKDSEADTLSLLPLKNVNCRRDAWFSWWLVYYTHRREYYSDRKRNRVLAHAAAWTNPENMLSDRSLKTCLWTEASQTQTTT